jgi:preprotein translocase subunit SecE
VAEWSIAAVLKTAVGTTHRGFESLPLRQDFFVTKFYLQLLIWAAVIGTAFGLLWKYGYLTRFATYVGETRDELKKCAWPSRDELRDTTVLVLCTIALLAAFLLVVDFGILKVIRALIE